MDQLEKRIIEITSHVKPVDFICKGHFAYDEKGIKYCELPNLVGPKVQCAHLVYGPNDEYCLYKK